MKPKCKQKNRCKNIRVKISQVVRNNNLAQKIEDLYNDKNMPIQQRLTQMNDLDDKLSTAMLHSLGKYKKQWPYWWTPEIHEYYIILQIWKLRRNEIALGQSFHEKYLQLFKKLKTITDEYMDHPMSSISSQIRRVKLNL